MKKKRLSVILPILLILIGYYILMFPIVSNLLNSIFNLNSISNYSAALSGYTDDELDKMLENCRKYNEQLAEYQKTHEFHYQGSSATDDTYKNLPMSGDIGSLEIPKINVDVVISHGTKDNELRSGAGHLYGTSFPIDGESVHAVIAAHSALSTAELFTHLNKLEKGDKFYVTVLDKKYEYKVDQITVCLPEEDYEYEQIIEGRNYVTLYTCTPYGVNDHRLLVRGEFTGSVETADLSNGNTMYQVGRIIWASVKFALVILGPFITAVTYGIVTDKRRRKKKC